MKVSIRDMGRELDLVERLTLFCHLNRYRGIVRNRNFYPPSAILRWILLSNGNGSQNIARMNKTGAEE